jgi:hypothetical protein
MGMQLEGADELMVMLRQLGPKATDGIFEQMKVEAQSIRDLARTYAPIDHGNLEDAIKMEVLGGGRDARGRFVRKALSVFIDMDAEGYNGEPMSQYAYIMHEHLTPYGPLNLGKRSAAKDGGSGRVGGRFLERAADEVSARIMSRLIDVAKSYF